MVAAVVRLRPSPYKSCSAISLKHHRGTPQHRTPNPDNTGSAVTEAAKAQAYGQVTGGPQAPGPCDKRHMSVVESLYSTDVSPGAAAVPSIGLGMTKECAFWQMKIRPCTCERRGRDARVRAGLSMMPSNPPTKERDAKSIRASMVL